MGKAEPEIYAYVVKAEELLALNYLPHEHPRPQHVEWINRATDRVMSPSTVEQLLRTLHLTEASASVIQLRETSGVRASFASEHDRNVFAREFHEACKQQKADLEHLVTAIFPSPEVANAVTGELISNGIAKDDISVLWRSPLVPEAGTGQLQGHSRSRVLASVSGGGIAGAAVGVAILFVPGVGPVAAVGAVLASTFPALATVSGIIGATGAAMATMLTDLDVEDFAENHIERQFKQGKAFVAVKIQDNAMPREEIAQLLEQNQGRCIM
ncbi:hypothetical protein [Aurantiacibacter marinus]|uniref:Uncharacterized protein n=1 Tax=Aurantiacibacter marinus TaxID=874156 RepID=A0A0H0XVU6_9SPHN|nr:hypothetical protein [Aurantiacibacter marinus]KLI64395.1 hypothetical protein AAV99_01910 [Aurantiacibacter marinus]